MSAISITCKSQNPEWVVYNIDNSGLPNNNILSISVDNITKWIGTGDNFQSGGTFGGGLTKFDNTSWISYFNESSDIPNDEYKIWSIAIDEQSRKWIGTNEAYTDAVSYTHLRAHET